MKHLFSLIITLFFINSASSAQTTTKASSNSPVCEGNALKLTAEGGTSYDWKGPDGFNSKEQNPIINNATAKKSGTYTVVINGISTVLVLVKVGKPLIDYHYAYASAIGNYISVGAYTNINLSSNIVNQKYSWAGPNGFTSTQQNVVILGFNKKNQGIYTSSITDESGCISQKTTELALKNPDCPYTLPISYGTVDNGNTIYNYENAATFSLPICKGTELILKADTTYFGKPQSQWYKDEVAIIGANEPSYSVKEEGAYYLKLIGKGCEYLSRKVYVQLRTATTTSISNADSITICKEGGSVSLNGYVAEIFSQKKTLQWFRNDNPIDGVKGYDYTAKESGEYRFAVQADNCGGSSKTVKVISGDKIESKIFFRDSPDIKDLKICNENPQPVYFSVKFAGNFQLLLNGNDIYSPRGIMDKSGVYKIITSQGKCSASDSIKLTFGKKHDLTITEFRFSTLNCNSLNNIYYSPIYYSSLSGGNLIWTKDGKAFSESVNLSPEQPGNYQLKYNNPQTGCSGESSIIKVDKPFDRQIFKLANAGRKSIKICQGTSHTLMLSDTRNCYAGSVLWKKDGKVLPNENDCQLTVIESGKYWMEYNLRGCIFYSDTITIETSETPTVSLRDSCLKNNSITLLANASSNVKYQWYQNDVAIKGANDKSYNASNNGIFRVQVINNDCSRSSNPIIVGVLINNPTVSICRGDSLKLTSQGNSIKSYSWTGPNNYASTQQNITFSAKTAGVYTVTTTANNGCIFSNKSTVKLSDYPSFSLQKKIIVCEGQDYQITGFKTNKLTDTTETSDYIVWQGPNQFASQSFNPIITKITNVNVGVYTATVGAYNSVCKATATTSVSINQIGNCKSISLNNLGDGYCPNAIIEIGFTSTGLLSGTKFKVIRASNNAVLGEGTKSPISIKIPDSENALREGIYIISDDKTQSLSRFFLIMGASKSYIRNVFSESDDGFKNCDSVSLFAANNVFPPISAIKSYQWFLNGNEIKGEISPDFNAKKTGQYTVKTIDVNNCVVVTGSKSVTIGQMEKPYISGNLEIFCGQEHIILRASSGSNNNYKFKWIKDGNIETDNGESFKATKAGKYLVEISKDKCLAVSDTIVITKITGNKLPVNLNRYEGPGQILSCDNTSVLLDYYPNKLDYEFFKKLKLQFFKDGVESNIKSYNITNLLIKEPGVYSIRASIGECIGISNEVKIERNTIKKVLLNKFSTDLCEGNLSNFYKSTDFNSRYDYEINQNINISKRGGIKMFRDGVFIDVKNKINYNPEVENIYDSGDYIQISTPIQGKYYTSETVTYADNTECTAISDTVQIKSVKQLQLINSSFDKTINAIPITSCKDTLTLYGQNYSSENNRPTAFTWKKDGITTKDSTETLTTAQAGIYQLETRYKGGCSAISQPYKVEFGKVKLTMNISEAIVCEGVTPNSILMYATNTAGTNDTGKVIYQWQKDGQNLLKETNYYTYANQLGKYKLTAKQGKCEGISSEINIKSDKLPTNISPIDSAKFCEGASTPLSLSTEAGLTYQWENDGSSIKNAINSSYGAASEGTYQALLRRGTCWDYSKKVKVTANILPKTISISDTLICPNLTSTLKVIPDKKAGTQGIAYAWEKDNKTTILANNAEVKAQEKGLYRVLFKRENCSSYSNFVKLNHKDIPTAVSPLDTSFCANGTIELKGQNVANTVYQWEKDENPIVSATTANLKIGEIGKYRVLVKKDGCEVYSKVANITQKPATTALITGDKSINYADSSKVSIAFTSDAPWTFKFSDGKEYIATKSPFEVSVKPQFTTTYSLLEVKNICGIGTVAGTAKIEVIVLSAEEEKELNVEVFPVPSSEICNWKIQTALPAIASVVLYDVLGVTQHSQTSTNRTQIHEGIIDLTNLKVGTYYLKLQVGDKSVTRKVVKY